MLYQKISDRKSKDDSCNKSKECINLNQSWQKSTFNEKCNHQLLLPLL